MGRQKQKIYFQQERTETLMLTFHSCEHDDKCIYQNEMSLVFKQYSFMGK